MKYVWIAAAFLTCGALAFAGGGASWWDIDDARMASKIEIKVDKSGMHKELEYHLDPAFVPGPIRAAMTAKYPGLPHVGAEKEWEGGKLFWELSVVQNGKKVEAMFTPEGVLHSQEIEIGADEVPAPVKAVIAEKFPQGSDLKWEKILDGRGNLVEYHVKLKEGGKNHKLLVSSSGRIFGWYLEVQAEIEVPAPPR